MRKWLVLAGALCVLPVVAGRAAAADDDKEARAVVEKAVKAMGGADKLGKVKAFTMKAKGKVNIMGNTLDYTMETSVQMPNQTKSVIEVEANGMQITVVQVFNKTKGWIKVSAGGQDVQDMEIKDDMLKNAKQQMWAQQVTMLVPLLKNKSFKLSSLGEEKVNGKPAVGVKVSSKGYKDVNLYFDKTTHLLVKQTGPALNQEQQEVTQETLYSDYKKVDGVQRAMKLVINQDGKEFVTAKISEWKAVDKIDETEFAKPGSDK